MRCDGRAWGPGSGANRVTITSGRNSRITRTMSARTASRSQIRSVSSVVLRVPEVLRAREILPPSIQAPGGEQLLGAGHTQLLAELGAEQVLAAVAAREREIGRPVSATARQVGDGLRVLVVRMRRDVEHAAQRAEAAQLLADGGARREIGGVAHPGAAGQHACHEGAPPHHPAGAPALFPRFER